MRTHASTSSSNERNAHELALHPRETTPNTVLAASILARGLAEAPAALQPVQLSDTGPCPPQPAMLNPTHRVDFVESKRAQLKMNPVQFNKHIVHYLPPHLTTTLNLEVWGTKFATEMDAKPFENFLADIHEIRDYQIKETRPQLQGRLAITLRRMENNQRYRTAVFAQCRSLDSTCGDGRAMQLDEMEDLYLLTEDEHRNALVEDILTTGLGFFIRAFADKAADKKTTLLMEKDEDDADAIETKLHFRTGLRDLYRQNDGFELPVGTQEMSSNRDVSEVNDDEIEAVYLYTLEQTQDTAALLEFYLEWSPFHRHFESTDKKISDINKKAQKLVAKEIKSAEQKIQKNTKISAAALLESNLELVHKTSQISRQREADIKARCRALIAKSFDENRVLFDLKPTLKDKRTGSTLSLEIRENDKRSRQE